MSKYLVIRKEQVQKECIACRGTGMIKAAKKQCQYCGGKGYTLMFRTTEVPLKVALAELQYESNEKTVVPESSCIEQVIKTLCDHYHISREELFDHRRDREIVELRYLFFRFVRTEFRLTYSDIGRKFGGFDHATVRRGRYEVEEWTKSDKLFATKFNHFNFLAQKTLCNGTDFKENNVNINEI